MRSNEARSLINWPRVYLSQPARLATDGLGRAQTDSSRRVKERRKISIWERRAASKHKSCRLSHLLAACLLLGAAVV